MLQRGRPPVYSTEEKRRRARRESQRKYNLSRKQNKRQISYDIGSNSPEVEPDLNLPVPPNNIVFVHRSKSVPFPPSQAEPATIHDSVRESGYNIAIEFPNIAPTVVTSTPALVAPDTDESNTRSTSNLLTSITPVCHVAPSFALHRYLNDCGTNLPGSLIGTPPQIQMPNSQPATKSLYSNSSIIEPPPGQPEQHRLTSTTGTQLPSQCEGDSCVIMGSTEKDIIPIASSGSDITNQSILCTSNRISETACSPGGQSYQDTSSHNSMSDSNADSSLVDVTPSIWTTPQEESLQYESSGYGRSEDEVHGTGGSIPVEGSNGSQELACFLAKQIFRFSGCHADSHRDSLLELIQRGRATDSLEGTSSTPQFTRPWDSKSVRAGSETIPLVLAKDSFLSPNSYKLTPAVAKLVYSGIVEAGEHTYTESLSFIPKQERVARLITPTTYLDIDSVLAFPTSLAIARKGIKVAIAPGRHCNIQADLHVPVPVYNFHNNRSYVKQAAISEIPHFQLGHMYGADDYRIFLLFPKLCHKDRKTNFLNDHELARFMDQIFLPAIRMHCPAPILQHLPGSFEMAKQCTLAAGVEPISRQTKTSGRTQLLRYYIPPAFLHHIWNTIIERTKEPGLYDFGEPVILIDAKNLKLTTMFPDVQSTITSFLTDWNLQCDKDYYEENSVWVDLATEEIHERGRFRRRHDHGSMADIPDYEPSGLEDEAFTFLWRECCLKSYERRFDSLFPHETCSFLYYQWGLTREIANLNVTPGKQHPARVAGLAYSQFYTTTKEVFDAAKVYPFQNKALEGLAVDPNLKGTWQEIDGRMKENFGCIKSAYLASKRRALESISACSQNSYGTRQEHRVNLLLLTAMSRQFELLQNRCLPVSPPDEPVRVSNHPYMISATNETFLFLLSNVNKFCFGFEYTRSLSAGRAISWEQTRVMVMFLRLLRHAYGGAHLERYSDIWSDTYTCGREKCMKIGLNLGQSITNRGYGFLSDDLIDWQSCQFRYQKSDKLGFSITALQYSYNHRYRNLLSVTHYYDLFSKVLANLLQHRQNTRLLIISCQVLSCTLIELFREDIWTTLVKDRLHITTNQAKLTDPSQSLCLMNLKQLLNGNLEEFKFIKNYNRHQFHPFERVTYLWDYDTQRHRKQWVNKQWRTLFQLVCDELQYHFPNRDILKRFRQSHFHRFLTHNLIFPQPVNGKFHQKCKDADGNQQRVWYCAHNTDNKFVWNEADWECGSTTAGSYNHIVPPQLLYSRTMLQDLLSCIDGGQVITNRLESLHQRELSLDLEPSR
ncbi:hypothetical protein L873DRAFT_1821642 [Choiromyces venosus 120613-1]|uniref:Uncharacterized protein n=1 Tax=Choiromyces venosus 120613-1 TaxID=1336337 RepID=A0A3N4IW01_9PEZI|nr:hypothetical protein L873DRAFT_1821642 [Choiromyces venosus 120613-1]